MTCAADLSKRRRFVTVVLVLFSNVPALARPLLAKMLLPPLLACTCTSLSFISVFLLVLSYINLAVQ